MISRASISAVTRALGPTVKLPSPMRIFPSNSPSRQRSPRPEISPLILRPWLTHAGAFGETEGAASAGRCGEGTEEGVVSGEGCGLFASALGHIRHLHAANSEAAELGCRRTRPEET